MTPLSKKKKKPSGSGQRQATAAKPPSSVKPLIWMTVIIVAIIVFIFLGIRSGNAPVKFDYGSYPTLGSADAPVKIVEFGDYKCPHCAEFSQNFVPLLEQDFIESGRVSLHFVNFTFMEKDSRIAAVAAQSVYHQDNDAFWKYYKALFRNLNTTWTKDALVQLAKDEELGIDYDKLRQDIEAETYGDEVDGHNALARKGKVTGTPTLFLNGKQLDSSHVIDYAVLKRTIEEALNGGT